MSVIKFLVCAGIVALATSGAWADTFNVKAGAWESTVTSTTTGTAIPPDMLSKLPPDQRAKIEEAMRARSGQPHTITRKYCVTQEDLDEDRLFEKDRNSQCSRKVLSRSSSRIELEQTCGTAPHTMTMHVSVQATSPESVTLTVDGQMQGGSKSHTEGKSRWLGASCAGVEKD